MITLSSTPLSSVGVRLSALLFFAAAGTALPVRAQCQRWTHEFELPGVTAGSDVTLSAIRALERFEIGAGAVLVAGGNFTSAGAVPAPGLASWNGSAWTAMNPLVATAGSPYYVSALLAFGSDLYVGGTMATGGNPPGQGFVSRLGAAPAVLGTFTLNNAVASVDSLAMFNGELHACGSFKNANGVAANRVARYTGSTWAPLGAGISGSAVDLEVFDDGNGPQLYVAGTYTYASGIATYGVSRWNGASWSTAGAAFGQWGWFALEVFDDGGGPGLYAAAWHQVSGDVVLKYGGNHWSIVGAADNRIHSLATLDDGTGSAFYAGGMFDSIDGVPANGIAKWDGNRWRPLGDGLEAWPPWMNSGVRALETFHDGSGTGQFIHAGGYFNRADGDFAKHFSAWKPCVQAGVPFCFGDGSLATPCPCAPPNFVPNPSGAPDSGCANVHNASGAKLIAVGSTQPDEARLFGSSLTNGGFTVFFAGTGVIPDGAAYGDGVRCVSGTILRFGSQHSQLGNVSFPNLAIGLDRPLSEASAVTPGSGQTRYYQAIYRDLGQNFCSAGTLNVTNAVQIIW